MDGFLSVIGPWVVLVVSFVLALLASRVLRLAARMSIGVDKVAGKGVEVVKGGTRTVGKVVEAGAKQAKSGVERGVATARSVVSAGSKHTVLLGNATISRMKAWNRAGVARLKEAAKRSKGVLGRFRRKT